MFTYNKEELPERLHDAVLLCELMGMKWISLYMDKNGGLAVSFSGMLSEEQVRNVQMHLLDLVYNDTNIDRVKTEYFKDYIYLGSKQNGERTIVYTPDGLDYRKYVYKMPCIAIVQV